MLAPDGSLTRILENSVFHVAPECRLDRVVDAACARHRVEVVRCVAPLEESRERVKAELRALWG